MDRIEFAVSSVSALGTYLWFLTQVLSFLRGAFSGSLHLLMVDMMDWLAIGGAPLYWTRLWGFYSGYLSPVASWRVEQSQSSLSKCILGSYPTRSWCVSNGQPLQPARQAWELELRCLIENSSSRKTVSFISLPVCPWRLNALLFSPHCMSWAIPLPTQARGFRAGLHLPYLAGLKSLSINWDNSFVQAGFNLPACCTHLCVFLQNRWYGKFTWVDCNFSWLCHVQGCREATVRGSMYTNLGGFSIVQRLSSVLCIECLVFGKKKKEEEKNWWESTLWWSGVAAGSHKSRLMVLFCPR